jgi:hypothetical protein
LGQALDVLAAPSAARKGAATRQQENAMKKFTLVGTATAVIATAGLSVPRADRARLFGKTEEEDDSSCWTICLLSLSGLAISLALLAFVPSAAEGFVLLGVS